MTALSTATSVGGTATAASAEKTSVPDVAAETMEAVSRLRRGGHDAVMAAAREVAADLATRAASYDRSAEYPAESIAALWRSGLGALTIPAELGGVGASLASAARATELLAAADAATTLIAKWTIGQLRLVVHSWPEPWRSRLVTEALAGPALLNALRVEPDLGTPARGGVPATTAVRVTAPDGSPAWRINGRKLYSTGSHGLRWMVVWGATSPDDALGLQVGSFLVPGDAAGVEIVAGSWDHLGMRASASHDVVFRDVIIPLENVVGLTSFTGVDPAMNRQDPAAAGAWINVLAFALYQGVAKAARDWLVGFLNERTPANLGRPLATLERFQSAVGEIEALLFMNEQLIYGLADRFDAVISGTAPADSVGSADAALTKLVVYRNVIRITESAVGLIGNPGLTLHHPLQRHYRDALCSRVHTPQDDVILLGAGRTALGV